MPQERAERIAESVETLPETLVLQVQPVGPAMPAPVAPAPPTLDAAFMVLCQALALALAEDIPGQAHADEIQGWYANGGSNIVVAWQHAVMLLERVLGAKLGG